MAKKQHKVLSSENWVGRQTRNTRQIIQLASGHRIKIDISIDTSYNFQSYARVEVFSPQSLQWNHLDSIPYPNLDSSRSSFTMTSDINRLIEKAETILGS